MEENNQPEPEPQPTFSAQDFVARQMAQYNPSMYPQFIPQEESSLKILKKLVDADIHEVVTKMPEHIQNGFWAFNHKITATTNIPKDKLDFFLMKNRNLHRHFIKSSRLSEYNSEYSAILKSMMLFSEMQIYRGVDGWERGNQINQISTSIVDQKYTIPEQPSPRMGMGERIKANLGLGTQG